MKLKKESLNLTLDEEVVKAIKRRAASDRRSFSQYINRVLKKHVEDNAYLLTKEERRLF